MRIRSLLCVAALAFPGFAVAQSGRQAPLILLLPAGTRSLALGNTGVASRDDEAIFFDPAMLAVATGFSASGERISSDAATGAVSAVTRLNRTGGVGVGMRFAHAPLPSLTYPASRATMLGGGGGGMITSLEAIAGIAQVYRGVRIGVAGKYTEDVTPSRQISRALADVGVSKDFFRTTFAFAVQNIGEAIEHDEGPDARDVSLPLRATVGASKQGPVGPFDLFGTAAVSTLGRDVIPSGGLEASYSWLSGYAIALRGGIRRAMIGEDAATAGAAFTMDRLSIDYALETLDGGRVGQRVGIRIR
jgi:hypothetical protein